MTASQQAVMALVWGVKQSFRAYVEAAGGTIDMGAGAARQADGAFVFPAARRARLALGADGKPRGRGDFAGDVRFEAHGGMLNVFLADPTVEITEAGGAITVADNEARAMRGGLAVLDLDAASREGAEVVIPTKLSKDGWRVLGDHYPPMTPLDPVRLRVE
jgi:hypothetical protein